MCEMEPDCRTCSRGSISSATQIVSVTYPHQREDLLGTFRPEWIALGPRNVAYLAWEQKDVNPLWKAVYDRYDEVWAISEFAATGFRGNAFGAGACRAERP